MLSNIDESIRHTLRSLLRSADGVQECDATVAK